MYRTVTRNLRKRKMVDGTWYIETTTMYQPAGNAESVSVAELTYNEANLLKEGRKKRGRWRLMYDHRWGEVKDTSDEDALRLAITEAYGDALAWMDLDSLVDEFYDSRNEIADSRRYFLNARTSAADAWIAEHEWAACKRPGSRSLQPGDFIALGFDGSIRDDSTALCAVRISDMHVQLLGCWAKPDDAPEGWSINGTEVDAAVAEAFRTYEVAAFYADPPHWQSWIDHWTAEYSERLQVSATQAKPLEWWTNRDRAASAALERFLEAVQEQHLGYTPWEDRDPDSHEGQMIAVLTSHVLAARRAPVRGGMLIRKDTPKSKNKIDAAMAAMLALEAASDCVAKGAKPRVPERRYIPKRLR